MTCRELMDFLMDYLDGNLPPEKEKVFKQHLGICTQCVDYLETYKRTVDAAKVCRETEDVPEDVPEDLIRAILEARKA